MSTVTTIKQTKNYDLFKLLPPGKNRQKIDLKHVEDLKESMQQYGFFISQPIVVDSSFVIKNGQHRFLAAKSLGIPLLYLVDDEEKTTSETARLQHALVRKWRPIDVIYNKKNNTNYRMLLEYSERYKLEVTKIYTILTGKIVSMADKEFTDGHLVITQEMVARFYRILPKLNGLIAVRGGDFKSQLLAVKVLKVHCVLIELPEYNHQQMLKNLKNASMDVLFTFNKPKDATAALQKIHNGSSRSKNSKVNLTGVFL